MIIVAAMTVGTIVTVLAALDVVIIVSTWTTLNIVFKIGCFHLSVDSCQLLVDNWYISLYSCQLK